MLLALILSACNTGPRMEFDQPACQADYLAWDGGITWLVLQGGGEGDFDVDPADPLVTRAFGNYELATGDYVYILAYDADHWRDETRIEGYGYAASNGDLDVVATWTTTDDAGNVSKAMIREERVGCDVERRTLRANGVEEVLTGTYRGAQLEYERVVPSGSLGELVWTGVARKDFSLEESVQASGGGASYEATHTEDGEGNSRTDWTYQSSQADQEGYDTIDIAGTWESVWTDQDTDCTWETEVDFAGDGGGTYTCDDGTECDITYRDGACTYNCGSGTQSC